MAESIANPTCPDCGSTMVRGGLRSDWGRFRGFSSLPVCRGTREMARPAATPNRLAGGTPTVQKRDRRLHFDRIVLVFGAVGLLIRLGFVVVGVNRSGE